MSLTKALLLTFCVIFLVVISLQRLLGVYAVFITALFMFLDVDYFLQVFWRILVSKFTSRSKDLSVLDTSEYSFYVLLSDLDFMLHMNNARYPRQCDFSRIQHWFESGIRATMKKFSCRLVVGAFTIRYRRSLQLFQKVMIKSKVLCILHGAVLPQSRQLCLCCCHRQAICCPRQTAGTVCYPRNDGGVFDGKAC